MQAKRDEARRGWEEQGRGKNVQNKIAGGEAGRVKGRQRRQQWQRYAVSRLAQRGEAELRERRRGKGEERGLAAAAQEEWPWSEKSVSQSADETGSRSAATGSLEGEEAQRAGATTTR